MKFTIEKLIRMKNKSLWSSIYLGLCFAVLFSADFTIINMQKTLTYSISLDNPTYTIDGYVNLGVTYFVYGIFLWLAPSVVALTGPKLGLFSSSIGFIIMIFSLTIERVWATYAGMVIAGIAGSLLWVSEGNYMVLTSSIENMSRNVGIFWALYCSSLIFGNIFAVFEIKDKTVIDFQTRHTILYSLGIVAACATIMFIFLPFSKENKIRVEKPRKPMDALKNTLHIICKKNFQILLITFIYAGFQQSFGQGIYSPCLGFTKNFENGSKQLVPLSGLVYGLGDLSGGSLQIFWSKILAKRKHWSSLVIVFGFVLQAVAYLVIYLNIPNNAVFGETYDSAIIESSIGLALMCSFLIGIGDSCLNTQIYPLIAALEPTSSAETCALYKFMKSMAMALCFFCSPLLGLHIQVVIISIFGILSVGAFVYVNTKFHYYEGSFDPNDCIKL